MALTPSLPSRGGSSSSPAPTMSCLHGLPSSKGVGVDNSKLSPNCAADLDGDIRGTYSDSGQFPQRRSKVAKKIFSVKYSVF